MYWEKLTETMLDSLAWRRLSVHKGPTSAMDTEENNPKWALADRTGLLVQLAPSAGHRKEPAQLVVNCPGPPVGLSSRHAHPAGCVCMHKVHTRQPA